MKTAKKYLFIIIIIATAAFIVLKLFSNKKQMDNDLKTMQEYDNVIPIEIVTPEKQQTQQPFIENGILRSGAEVSILSETSGQVISVSGEIGEYVGVGQTLVVVEKKVIESQLQLASINLENAKKDLDRFNNLATGEAITSQQLETSELNYQNALTNFISKKKELENAVIKTPVNGIIAKRSVEKGTYIIPSSQLFSIQKQNQMIFVVKVAENDLLQLNKGQKAKISVDVISDKTFTGNIQSIAVVPDLSGRYEVEIGLNEQEVTLREGMSGEASFKSNIIHSGLVIPRKCIVGSINDARLFILKGDSVMSQKVESIAINETDVLITAGLSSNDKVVLSGQINLQDGSKVKVINK